MFRLDGKTALVTGSTQNLGRAIANDLAAQGADVIVSNSSGGDSLDQAISELRELHDSEISGVSFDLTDPQDVERSVGRVVDENDGVDILVNNAAIRPSTPLEEITVEEWDTVFQTNLRGPFLCARAVLPSMRAAEWGRIISISGPDGFTGKIDRLHGVSTKAGIVGFARALAQEVADSGITSNCIVPGVFDTDRVMEWYPNLEYRHNHIRSQIPLGRIGDATDLSPMAVFLASEESRYVTGQAIHVNGGRYPTVRDPMKIELSELEALVESHPDYQRE